MAKKLKVGDAIRGYHVTKVFGPGAMAISYAAQAAGGTKIFLKQYKSPAPTVVWYSAFVDYQQELAARVRNGKAGQYAVRLVDAFEEVWGGRCYFQAYEFVEHGGDLQQMLDAERETHQRTGVSPLRDSAVWARHVTWAKVLMAGIAGLHESKIVHADLKPPNVYLIRDPSIGSGYQLKLIDMDFSVLADHRAPWHGYQGYVGSDNYRSPEHLTRGATPGLPSDIFTCGLMLYELLAGVHPYWREDQAEYANLVRAYGAKPPEYAIWKMMNQRCSNPDNAEFKHYGARGIRVCERWRAADGFAIFLADVGPQPFAGAGLRRLDPNGHFEPGNVEWGDTRTRIMLTHEGQTLSLADWATRLDMNERTLRARFRQGWTAKAILNRPLARRDHLALCGPRSRKKAN